MSRSDGIVVVRRAERATILASLCEFTSSMNVWIGTSTPRSITSNPALSNIIPTRFLPISWRSPATVPRIMVPALPASPVARYGFRTSTPAFIARAAASICGTKIISFLKLSPTTAIAPIIASFKIAVGSQPASSASWTACPISLFLPSWVNLNTFCIFSSSGEAGAGCTSSAALFPNLSIYCKQYSSRSNNAFVA